MRLAISRCGQVSHFRGDPFPGRGESHEPSEVRSCRVLCAPRHDPVAAVVADLCFRSRGLGGPSRSATRYPQHTIPRSVTRRLPVPADAGTHGEVRPDTATRRAIRTASSTGPPCDTEPLCAASFGTEQFSQSAFDHAASARHARDGSLRPASTGTAGPRHPEYQPARAYGSQPGSRPFCVSWPNPQLTYRNPLGSSPFRAGGPTAEPTGAGDAHAEPTGRTNSHDRRSSSVPRPFRTRISVVASITTVVRSATDRSRFARAGGPIISRGHL
jgi:hypothetical protein